MRRTHAVLLSVAICSPLALNATAQTKSFEEESHRRSTELLEANPTLDYDPTTLLVRFLPHNTEVEREDLRRVVGAGKIRQFVTVERMELIDVQIDVETAIRLLEPHVEYAEPNWVQRKTQVPNDQFFSLQWGIHNTGQTIQGSVGISDADIDGTEAWDITTGDPNFVVAVIDTGTDWDHPDLAANIWSNPGEVVNGQDDDGNGYVDDVRGWDFYSGDSNPDDEDGHGSHTAGTVGAVGNNGIGVAGVNWDCKMVPLRFLGPQGGYTSDAISAVEYCTTMGIKVSNNSWGGGGFSSSLNNAIAASKSVDHVFVAAAGNSGTNNDSSPHYPSNYSQDNIISVAAIGNRDELADEPTWGSNYGATTVDIGAPGVDIASTWEAGGYVWSSGTSMATPHVAGVVSLVFAQNPGWSYSDVIDRIYSTGRSTSAMSGKCTTGKVLNAYDAVNGGGPPPDTTPPDDPSGLGASAGDGSVSLDWSNNGEGDLAGYRVYRSTSSGGGYSAITGLIGSSDYSDSSVTNGTTYYYVVTAEDTSGNESGNSAEVSATPQSQGGGGEVETIFFGGFESGNFSAEGWSTSGNVKVTTKADQGGSYGARIKRSSWIEKAVSTAGYDTIELSYARRTRKMDSGEYLTIEYWNGSAWITVESTQSTSWSAPAWSLGSDADDNAAFKIRFRTNANRNNERGDVDDVEVIGTTL
jgi:subtilisin family serine protease